jgi:hypothetical protein
VEEVERARAALRAAPARALAVTSSAPGTAVFVNGRRVGVAPLRLALAPGRYRVSGAHGGSRAGPREVALDEGDEDVVLDFTLPLALRPALGPGIALPDADLARWAVAAGGHLGLDELVAVTLVSDGAASYAGGARFDVRRGMLVREGRVRLAGGVLPPGGYAALAGFLVTGQASSSLVEVAGEERTAAARLVPPASAAPPPLDLRTPAEPEPARARADGWVSLAAVAATLGLGAYGLVELRAAGARYDGARQLRATGDLSDPALVASYNRQVLDGDSAKRTAMFAFAGAGVTFAAAGILGYLHYRRTGEVGPFRF